MNQCKCGSKVFKARIVTIANVLVSIATGIPVQVQGTEENTNIELVGSFVCGKCGAVYMDVGRPDESGISRGCSCGNTRFTASQRCYHDVIVNSDNIFIRDDGISDADSPYGPYCCTKCGAEYEYLSDLTPAQFNENNYAPPLSAQPFNGSVIESW